MLLDGDTLLLVVDTSFLIGDILFFAGFVFPDTPPPLPLVGGRSKCLASERILLDGEAERGIGCLAGPCPGPDDGNARAPLLNGWADCSRDCAECKLERKRGYQGPQRRSVRT